MLKCNSTSLKDKDDLPEKPRLWVYTQKTARAAPPFYTEDHHRSPKSIPETYKRIIPPQDWRLISDQLSEERRIWTQCPLITVSNREASIGRPANLRSFVNHAKIADTATINVKTDKNASHGECAYRAK